MPSKSEEEEIREEWEKQKKYAKQVSKYKLRVLEIGEETRIGDFCFDRRVCQPVMCIYGGTVITKHHHPHFRVTRKE